MDNIVNIQHEGDIRILQISDMQIIDANQRRVPERIGGWKLTEWVPEKNEENAYKQIRYLVKETSPDLIIVTGDLVYGEFDDAGTSFTEFANFMDSLQIPWAPVYGNHDNETHKGVEWQNKVLENAEYSLFKKGKVFGNGNYTVGISQNGVLKRVLFMMDSNGCGLIKITAGFRDDQLAWVKEESEKIHKEYGDIPLFMAFHIPSEDFADAYLAAGYQKKDEDGKRISSFFELGKDMKAQNDDFGKCAENMRGTGQRILPLLKECGVDGLFAGHWHKVNTSVLYEGIRFTFSLKLGLYDYYAEDSLGGTLITLKDKKQFEVKHIYYDIHQ